MSQEKKSRKSSLEVPGFMRADVGKGTEQISTRDCAWSGKDGELDEAFLASVELEVTPLDQAIAIAKVAGEARSLAVGVGRAAFKLHMPWETRKRGPKHHADDYLLCRIAEAYHHHFFESPQKYPELDPIIKEVIARHLPTTAPERHSGDALLARLRRKFNKQKDSLLSAVGAEDLAERGAALVRARRVLDDLEDAGIPIDRSKLDPALRRRPKRA